MPSIGERSESVCSVVRLAKNIFVQRRLGRCRKRREDSSVRIDPCEDVSVVRSSTTINRIGGKAIAVVLRRPKDTGEVLNGKLQSLKSICLVDPYEKTFSPWDLVNNAKTLNLESLFFNPNVIFRIFSTTPVVCACITLLLRTKRIRPRVKTDYQAQECCIM